MGITTTNTAPKTTTPRSTANNSTIGLPTVRSGMSDYDIGLRQDYSKRRAGIAASNEAKKANYFQAMDEQTQAAHDKRVQQVVDEIDTLTMRSIPMAQRATSENAHGSRHHNNFLQARIDDARTKLDKLGGLYADDKEIETVKPQTRARKWYATPRDMANDAAGRTIVGLTGLLDEVANVVPTAEGKLMKVEPEATFTGQLLKPITNITHWLDNYANNETNASAQRWRSDFADTPEQVQHIAKLSVDAMALLPYVGAALLSQGGSTVGSTTASASGAPVLSGAGNVALGTQISDKIVNGIKNPNHVLSALRDYDVEKRNAMVRGATEAEANAAGLTSAAANYMIGLGELSNLLPGPVEEGVKSVAQGIAGEAIEKATYDNDKKWFSWNEDDAVLNPGRDAKEFASSAITSSVSSGVQSIQQINTDIQTGKKIKDGGKTTELLQDALKASTESVVYNKAKEMSERLEAALIETGIDASDLYHMSKGDQLKLISHVLDQTLTAREIGELSRMLSETQG